MENLEKLNENEQLPKEGFNKVLTPDEVCRMAGISKSYLYKLTSNREIPFYKPKGKLIFFDRDEIIDWLLSNRHDTNAEIKSMSAIHEMKKIGLRKC